MNRKGQALVEFVLILPIFILMLFAIVDFGMILSKKNELENISVDVTAMIKNSDNIDDIKNLYPKVKINISSDDKYTKIIISDDVDIMTLNYIEAGYIDSMGLLQFIATLEDEFGITFSDEEMSSRDIKVVGSLVAMIEKKVASL